MLKVFKGFIARNSPLGIYPKEMIREKVKDLVTAVLLIKAKSGKQPKCV